MKYFLYTLNINGGTSNYLFGVDRIHMDEVFDTDEIIMRWFKNTFPDTPRERNRAYIVNRIRVTQAFYEAFETTAFPYYEITDEEFDI